MQQALTMLSSAGNALNGLQAVNTAILTGTVTYTAGSDEDTGSIKLEILRVFRQQAGNESQQRHATGDPGPVERCLGCCGCRAACIAIAQRADQRVVVLPDAACQRMDGR